MLKSTPTKALMSENLAEKTVFFISRNRRNAELVKDIISRKGFRVSWYADYETACTLCQEVSTVIIDVSGYDSNVFRFLDMLRSVGVPFVVLTGKSPSLVRRLYMSGAYRVLEKPVSISDFTAIIAELAGGSNVPNRPGN